MAQNQSHYDHVTPAWELILGSNLHYGCFQDDSDSLETATKKLIDVMADFGGIQPGARVLDVGCGVGAPSLYLHDKYNSTIAGISTSSVGVSKANQRARDLGFEAKVQFQVADGMNNGFPADSFNLVWVMESSHLMPDKQQLFCENYRVLKNNGTLVLCDLMLGRDLSLAEIFERRDELDTLEAAFGRAKMETPTFYIDGFAKAGFDRIEKMDVSREVIPTLAAWVNQATENRSEILKSISVKEFDSFLRACEILTDYFNAGLMGYGIIKGTKIFDD